MKTYIAIFRKELFHILRDKRTLFILICMPLAMVLIFGYAVTNEFKDSKIALLDGANDPLSEELKAHLIASGHFKVERILLTEAEIDQVFKEGNIRMVVVIPPDFSNTFYNDRHATIQFIIDGSEPNYANTLSQYGQAMVRRFASLKNSQFNKNTRGINTQMRMIYNPELKSSYNFLPGTIAVILLLISAMMTSLTIAREKETGTMEILLVSPVSSLILILGKIGPYALLSFLNALFILAIGYYVFDVPINGSLLLLLSLCALYVLTALSLGVLISTKAGSQQAAMMASLMSLMLPSMLLSGFLFPITSMPSFLQLISKIVPATYFIEIIKSIMLRGAGINALHYQVIVLAGMTFFFLALSLILFKNRLD